MEDLQFHSPGEKLLFEAFKNDGNPSLSLVDFYLFSEPGTNQRVSSILSDWIKFKEKLKRKKGVKDSEKFLKQVFYKVHRKFLKDYKNHSSLQAVLAKGEYDCLSGTSLYVLLLEELGYGYEIKETDYHIYLLVSAGNPGAGRQFLLESTDPVSGFISDENEILERQQLYHAAPVADETQVQGISTASPEYQFSRKVDNSINSYQLAGLHYYNQGIFAYNSHQYAAAIQSLHKALFLYKSPRIQEFLELTVAVALASDQISHEEKEAIEELHQKYFRSPAKEMAQKN